MPQAINGMSVTWTSGATENGIKLNVTDTSSAAASNLMDLQVGGASRFSVRKTGAIVVSAVTSGTPFLNFLHGYFDSYVSYTGTNNSFVTSQFLGFVTGMGNTADTLLARDAADTLALRRSTNAQTFRIYNTFTDASNYERGKIEWASNALRIGTEKLGTGTARALELQTDGTTRLTIGATGVVETSGAFVSLGASGVNSSGYLGSWVNGRIGFSGTASFAASTPLDTYLTRDGAAGALALKNEASPQTFRVYNTFTDASNYERGKIAWSGNILQIGTEEAGTGSARALEFQTDGTTRLTIAANGDISANRPVSTTAYLQTTGSLGVLFASNAIISAPASGVVRLTNWAETDFSRLQFGGTTSSFPALKRSTTAIQARLADDSAFTNIQGKLTTETPYTAGAPTATGYLVLYDSNGTAYKVPAVAL